MIRLIRLLVLVTILLLAFNIKVAASGPDATMIITNPGINMSTEMNVSWHTNIQGTFLEYTKSTDSNFTSSSKVFGECAPVAFESHPNTLQCKASLSNLEVGTEYTYRVGLNNMSVNYSFKTAGLGTFSFIHTTDMHAFPSIPSRVTQTNAIINKLKSMGTNVAFNLISGDATAYGAVYSHWDNLYTLDTIKTMPYAISPGNHDYYNSSAQFTHVGYYNSVTNNPDNGAENVKGSSYYFIYNNTLFISIDSEAASLSHSLLLSQQQWFREVVENNPSEFIVVFTHRPFYTGNGLNASQAQTSRDWWQSIFDEYGVDLVLSGHNHCYARTHPVFNNQIVSNTNTDGTIYVTGFQIGDRAADNPGTPMPQVAFAQIGKISQTESIHASVLFTVSATAINIQFIDINGKVLDSYQIGTKTRTFGHNALRNSLIIQTNEQDFSKATLNFMDVGYGRINRIQAVGEDHQLLGSISFPGDITSFNLDNIPTNVPEYSVDVKVTLRNGDILEKTFNLVNEKRKFGSISNLRVEDYEKDTYFLWDSALIPGRLSKLLLFVNGNMYKEIDPDDNFIIINDVSPYNKNELELKALNVDDEVIFEETYFYGENAPDVDISYDEQMVEVIVNNKIKPTITIEPVQELQLEFSSSNTEVAIVDENGEITAIAPGTAIITVNVVKRWDVYSTIEITVVEDTGPQDPQDPQDPNLPDEPKKGCFSQFSIINIGLIGLIILFRKRKII